MEHVQLHIEAEGANWREIYDERMERLKTRQFPIQDSASQQGMLQQELSGAEEIMNFELYKAVENGNVDRFVDMLEEVSAENKLSLSAIFYQVIPSGDSMLHVAANMGKEHIAELILYHFPKLLNKRNIRGDTALHVAAKSKSCGVIQVLLTQYANDKSIYGLEDELTRLTNECGDTPLHEAVYTGHLDVVTDLFHADRPVVHYLNKSGKSPLYLAVETGNVEILGLLLQTPFPQNKPLPQCRGNSPLHAAILEQKPALLKYILARRRELISLRDKDGWTALHYAAHCGYVEGVRILLNLSALTGIERDSKGRLPIHLACKRGHVMVVKELLQQEWPSPRVCLNQKGQNILHVAAKNGKVNVVKYLLRNKKIDQFTINEKDKNGNAPLHLASKNLFPKVLLVMTGDKRVELNRVNGEGLAALDIVLPRGILSSNRQLLSYATLRSSGASFKSGSKFNQFRRQPPYSDRRFTQETTNVLLLVCILLVTLTFSAGFSVPGGVYSSDDPNPHNRGMAVLADKALFKVFSVFNTIAMYCSTIGSIILLWERIGDVRIAKAANRYAFRFMCLGLLTMVVAFMAAVRLPVSNDSLLAKFITALTIIFLSIIVFIGVLTFFPLGYRLPLLRQVSGFVLWISSILFRSEDKPKHLDIQEGNKDMNKDK